MTDPITRRAAQLLTDSGHIIMPLEKLYQTLTAEGWMPWFTLEMLEDLLAEDRRFDLLGGLSDIQDFRPSLLAELEIQGLLMGPLVMLRDRALSSEIVMLDILSYLEAMNHTLETAWSKHAAQEMSDEGEILNLLMMGDMLERELKQSLRLPPFSEREALENIEADKI